MRIDADTIGEAILHITGWSLGLGLTVAIWVAMYAAIRWVVLA